MNPEIEDFLEEAFASMEPTSDAVGRVVVEPDYEAGAIKGDVQQIRNELIELLKAQNVDSIALKSQSGFAVEIPSHCQLLSKYVRRITMHADRVEGDWIEVAPPGYWI